MQWFIATVLVIKHSPLSGIHCLKVKNNATKSCLVPLTPPHPFAEIHLAPSNVGVFVIAVMLFDVTLYVHSKGKVQWKILCCAFSPVMGAAHGRWLRAKCKFELFSYSHVVLKK